MGENGKRYRDRRDNDDDDDRNHKRRGNNDHLIEKRSDELVVYRILCPGNVMGSVIGKSGKVINSIRLDTKSKIKVVDPFPGAKNRVITIYCYVKEKEFVEVDGEFNDNEPLCAAQDALLRVHDAISHSVSSARENDKKYRDKDDCQCQILVPSSQSANIIGKAGTTIKKLRHMTRTDIRITPKDTSDVTHACAMDFDNFLQITGEVEDVKKALFAVSAIMYKFSPREEISLETTVSEGLPNIIIPSDVPLYPSAELYPTSNTLISSQSLPPIFSNGRVPDLQGFGERGNAWPVYSSALPVTPGFGGSSQSEELIIRILCPNDKIGRVIGKGGSTIKSIRQDSGARIEVDDKRDRDECVITISATESPDDLKSMAVEAILLLQGKINDEDDVTVTIRLLVSSKFIGCIIGKSGSIIKEIRKRTKADIRISKGEKPKCADANDELVEMVGEVACVRDALIQIILRLRDDVLKDKDAHHNLSGGTDSLSSRVPSLWPSLPPASPMDYDQRNEIGSGLGLLSSHPLYGYGSLPSVGEKSYDSLPSYSSNPYRGLPAPSALEILVPASAVGKVLGKGGANITNIRKMSGAVIEISESKSSRGDRIALISGTSEQKRTAENMIQALIMAT